MKTRFQRFLATLALIISFSLPSFAQIQLLDCGTTGRSPWLEKYQAGLIPPVAKSAVTKYVPLRLTIVGEDDGSGYIDPLITIEAFQRLNKDFEALNIQFYLADEIQYVNSSFYYNHDFAGGRDLMNTYNKPFRVNSYIVGNPAGAGGYYLSSSDAIALRGLQINRNSSTWSHELGHFLSLPHTFYGWESVKNIEGVDAFDNPAPATLTYSNQEIQVERTDSSNCTVAADGFCDTPPDYLPEGWRCNSSGFYPDTLLDPDSVQFLVPSWNFMSYAVDQCQNRFSDEQITAMQTNLEGRIGLADRSTPTFTAARGEDLTLLSPADRSTADFSDQVELVWNSVPNADFYIVQINISNNFLGSVYNSFVTSDTSALVTDILTPSRRYYWRVRPVNRYDVSGSFSEPFLFRNGSFTVATIDRELDAGILIAPNPVSGGQDIQIAGRDLPSGKMNYQLIDAAGRVLLSQEGMEVRGQDFRTSLPTDKLAAGIYFLRLTLDNRLVTRRIVVTN